MGLGGAGWGPWGLFLLFESASLTPASLTPCLSWPLGQAGLVAIIVQRVLLPSMLPLARILFPPNYLKCMKYKIISFFLFSPSLMLCFNVSLEKLPRTSSFQTGSQSRQPRGAFIIVAVSVYGNPWPPISCCQGRGSWQGVGGEMNGEGQGSEARST